MKKMVTTKEAKAMLEERGISVSYTNLVLWVRSGKFPGAVSEDMPRGPVWMIPASSVAKFEPPKKGRPSKSSKKKGVKK